MEEFAQMSNEDLEEMKRQLLAEIDDIKEVNEDQAQKKADTEKEQKLVLEDIEKREKDTNVLDEHVAGLLKELTDKESQLREVFTTL